MSNFSTESEWGYLPEVDPTIHYIVGAVLTVIGSAGAVGNFLVLLVFTRYRRLRGPFSAFVVNLAIADFCTSLLHSMVIISSFNRRWVFGRIGCQLYAGGVGHFGLLSIVTMAAIAVERYLVITSKQLSRTWKVTQYDSTKICALAWLYCLSMSLPPALGWSQYVLEGLHTSCSWDYFTRSFANRAYYLYLLILGFVVPVAVILYCYSFIMAVILAHGRGVSSSRANGGVTLQANTSSRDFIPEVGHPLSSSFRTAEIILVLVVLFLISWTPYAVVTFIAQFGDERLITPWVAAIPAIFAKSSVVYNPIVYGLSHPHFRSVVRHLLLHCKVGSSMSVLADTYHHSLRGMRVARAVVSSPGTLRKCPETVQADCHSEPIFRESRQDTVLQWQQTKQLARCSLVTKHRHKKQNTAVTSEGLETIGNPPSILPQADPINKTNKSG